MIRPMNILMKTARFALAFFAIACATCAAHSETYKLKHAGLRTLYLAPIFIGIDRGIFKSRDLDLAYEEIDSGALSPAVILSGSAQITSDDILGIAPLAKQGKEFMMIYNLMDRMTMDLIVRKEIIARANFDPKAPISERAKILKGLTIGITRPGAPTDAYSRYFLIRAGLDPQHDATLTQVGGVAGLSAAFRSGRIDAFMLSPPLPQTLERDGFGTIIVRNTQAEVPELAGMSYITLFTSKEIAQKNKPALKAYVKGVQEALKWAHENRDEALKLLGQKWFKDTPAPSLALSFDVLLPALSTTGEFTPASLAKFVSVYKTIGENIDVDLSEGKLWTNEFVR
jgi:ABC-type nitrate/sulfonate/bicarbonate transport system substrate-binding protein